MWTSASVGQWLHVERGALGSSGLDKSAVQVQAVYHLPYLLGRIEILNINENVFKGKYFFLWVCSTSTVGFRVGCHIVHILWKKKNWASDMQRYSFTTSKNGQRATKKRNFCWDIIFQFSAAPVRDFVPRFSLRVCRALCLSLLRLCSGNAAFLRSPSSFSPVSLTAPRTKINETLFSLSFCATHCFSSVALDWKAHWSNKTQK